LPLVGRRGFSFLATARETVPPGSATCLGLSRPSADSLPSPCAPSASRPAPTAGLGRWTEGLHPTGRAGHRSPHRPIPLRRPRSRLADERRRADRVAPGSRATSTTAPTPRVGSTRRHRPGLRASTSHSASSGTVVGLRDDARANHVTSMRSPRQAR
jgi:hypothetical protein